ncbi:MAG: hypothetical protein Q8Q14_09795 [Gemmatimonadales bacterium]|nr:hypothetical protein [Gemmatimonadales bacterium]
MRLKLGLSAMLVIAIACGDSTAPCPTGTETFNYTGAIQTFTVPACVTSITIEAHGAQGGSTATFDGGLGARMRGTFAVSGGPSLKILVGGAGANSANPSEQGGGSGGGGSFVTDAANAPFVVAGGGGGGVEITVGGSAGADGLGGTTAEAGLAGTVGTMAGGTGGGGGTSSDWTGWHGGNGGGGLTGDGINNTAGSSTYGTPNTPGLAFINGGAGGTVGTGVGARVGGFGGGGPSGFSGGGGGGYSGGGAGGVTSGGTVGAAGGGGSFNGGTDPSNSAAVRAGNGLVTITY